MASCGGGSDKDDSLPRELLAEAKIVSKEETLATIEMLALQLLQSLADGKDPTLFLTDRSVKNVIYDNNTGHIHLGQGKTAKALFARRAVGAEKFTKMWQVLALIQRLVMEDKLETQREAYYTLVQYFKSQTEFNNTLQDVVALTGCTRSSLGLCASSSGAIAGCLLWKEEGNQPTDCSTSINGKRIPGNVEGLQLESLGARFILVVEKDAIFTYLCGQRLWDSLPCILLTGCGYPPLAVRHVLKLVSTQLPQLPVLGLFDYNPHGVQILLTYKLGSAHMGMEGHTHAVDIKWLGLHYNDIIDYHTEQPKIDPTALQPWTLTDQRVFASVHTRVRAIMEPSYLRELRLMEGLKLKAETESINGTRELDTLENTIIHKILCKLYF